MKAVLQRVARARVTVDGETTGEIGAGLLVYLGVAEGDGESDADALARRIVHARVFADAEDRMNRSVVETGGGVLVVSQFTLCADTSQRRPYMGSAAKPEKARALYERFVAAVSDLLARPVATGSFGAMMLVESVNDGPVTFLY